MLERVEQAQEVLVAGSKLSHCDESRGQPTALGITLGDRLGIEREWIVVDEVSTKPRRVVAIVAHLEADRVREMREETDSRIPGQKTFEGLPDHISNDLRGVASIRVRQRLEALRVRARKGVEPSIEAGLLERALKCSETIPDQWPDRMFHTRLQRVPVRRRHHPRK